jgi:hypothetical protein
MRYLPYIDTMLYTCLMKTAVLLLVLTLLLLSIVLLPVLALFGLKPYLLAVFVWFWMIALVMSVRRRNNLC